MCEALNKNPTNVGLEPENYSIVLNDNNVYTIVKTLKTPQKKNYTDALWALADDLRYLKDKA